LAIFFLQGRFLYVKNRLKFEWFVFEWARFAHFFILKAGQRRQAYGSRPGKTQFLTPYAISPKPLAGDVNNVP